MFSPGKYRLGRYLRNAGRIGWVFARPVYDSATTICARTVISDIRLTVPDPNVLPADVFGTGIFH